MLDSVATWLSEPRLGDASLGQWLGLMAALLVAWLVTVVLGRALHSLVAPLAATTEASWDGKLVEAARRPGRALAALTLFWVGVSALALEGWAARGLGVVLQTAFVAVLAWLVVRLVGFAGDLVVDRIDERAPSRAARGPRTRVAVLRRVLQVVAVVVAAAIVLLQFEGVRRLGVSLLASAGIAGVVLGLAAQKTLSTVFAGLQISISESVRIGDAVVVEGDWGQVEEMTLTYVVVRTWDLRRIVLPITYFIDKPFQNWTKTSPELLGAVLIHADYAVPLPSLRAELERLCRENRQWNGAACQLIVFDATADTLVLRATVSAGDANALFELRCHVREGLVTHLQALEGGRYLPRSRVSLLESERTPQPRTVRSTERDT